MPVRVVSSRAQQPITVNALVQNPLIITERVIDILSDQFVMDQVLRNAGQATGGAVQFRVSTGLFAERASEVVAEGAQIPLSTRVRGDIQSKPVHKRGLGVEITEEMRIRNDVGEVDRQLAVIKNTIVRDFDGEFVGALRSAVSNTRAAATPWATSTTIRADIIAARKLITNSQAPGTTSGQEFMGFQPDTLVINPFTRDDLLGNTNFLQLFLGTVAPSNTVQLPTTILGLTPQVTWGVPAGEAWVVQSKILGGYADEIPLRATELYPEQDRMAWRSDTVRSTVAFIDEPLAAAKITGV